MGDREREEWPLWVCPACRWPSEIEPGEVCESCEEGTIESIAVVPASRLTEVERVADELAGVLYRYRHDQAGHQLRERDADAALAHHAALGAGDG